MSLEVDNDEKTKIEKVITSADSPVGIDAKKNSHNHYSQIT